ncbi:MAG TPA: hypothetical protein VLK58_28650, partial [Conexibacter sp.]|nr:hypothetical protein [Conexibacter sp.]
SATFGRSSTFFDGRDSRAVLDDGRVYFDSADRLIPSDTNAVGDVYEHRPDRGLSLISSGTSGEAASFGDISENGRDIFFVTADRLVPQDADVLADLYSARADGGIAAQQVAPPAPGGGCSGEACRPAPAAVPPGSPVPGTEQFSAPDPVTPPPTPSPRVRIATPTARALRVAGTRGRLLLPVQVSTAGTVRATLRGRIAGRAGRVAARATGRAGKAGTVRLTLTLSRAARQQLQRAHRLRLRLTVSHSAGGTAVARTLTFTTAPAATSKKDGSG